MVENSTSSSHASNRGETASPGQGTRDQGLRSCPLVLIVEDERLTALDLKRRVQSYGYDVIGQVGVTAGEGVELALIHQPDLVLMDVRLKGGPDGIDAAEVILEELGYLPIVYLTAFSNDETIDRISVLNPAGFLCKPIDFQRLECEIAHALDWPKH
jgi:DNA-binding NarL/FixJ family response regulator